MNNEQVTAILDGVCAVAIITQTLISILIDKQLINRKDLGVRLDSLIVKMEANNDIDAAKHVRELMRPLLEGSVEDLQKRIRHLYWAGSVLKSTLPVPEIDY